MAQHIGQFFFYNDESDLAKFLLLGWVIFLFIKKSQTITGTIKVFLWSFFGQCPIIYFNLYHILLTRVMYCPLKMSHYFMLHEGCVLYTFVVFVIWNTNRKCKQWTFLSNFPWLCCDPFKHPTQFSFQMIIKWVCFVHLLIEKGSKKRLSTILANENITCLSTDLSRCLSVAMRNINFWILNK